jgi:hypothetical protein
MHRTGRRYFISLAIPAAVLATPFGVAAAPKLSPNDWVWKIAGKDGVIHYARSFQSAWLTSGDGFFAGPGVGTVVFTPLQNSVPSYITASDTWRVGSAPPGAEASWKGRQSGFAAITADGVQPTTVSGKGYGAATFKDLQSGQKTDVADFVAEKIRAGAVEGLVRHR